MLEQVSKGNRKDLLSAASEFYKSGAEPSTEPPRAPRTRAERRQLERALGFRGTKAKRHNVEKRVAEVRRIVLADEALAAAKDRAEHPIRSRLRRR